MWRGLMLTKAVEQFLRDVRWGELDYLLIDMPPGTGDVQMGLARMLPHTDLIVVTTPALAAQKVAQRAADMAKRSFLRVVGVIENMSTFTCDHGESYALFGAGGGQALADSIDAPLLGQIPLEPAVAAAGDAGYTGGDRRHRRGGRGVPDDRRSHRHRHRTRPTGRRDRHGGLLGAAVRHRQRGLRRPRRGQERPISVRQLSVSQISVWRRAAQGLVVVVPRQRHPGHPTVGVEAEMRLDRRRADRTRSATSRPSTTER